MLDQVAEPGRRDAGQGGAGAGASPAPGADVGFPTTFTPCAVSRAANADAAVDAGSGTRGLSSSPGRLRPSSTIRPTTGATFPSV
ncbi:hypothetical protein ACFQ9X_01250 [Catenulispora yoronensis]